MRASIILSLGSPATGSPVARQVDHHHLESLFLASLLNRNQHPNVNFLLGKGQIVRQECEGDTKNIERFCHRIHFDVMIASYRSLYWWCQLATDLLFAICAKIFLW